MKDAPWGELDAPLIIALAATSVGTGFVLGVLATIAFLGWNLSHT